MGDRRLVRQPKRGNTLATEGTVPDQRLRAFVLDVVNAAEHKVDGSTDYFFRQYEEFFPTKDVDIEVAIPWFGRRWTTREGLRQEVPQIYYRAVISELRGGLRAVWKSEDDETAELRLFNVQLVVHRVMDIRDDVDKDLQPSPADGPIHQAIQWVRRNLLMLRVCPNFESRTTTTATGSQQAAKKVKAEQCRTPFFVADKSQRRFCSEGCAEVAQRKHKLRWWNKTRKAQKRATRRQSVTEHNTTNPLQTSSSAEIPMRVRPGRIKRNQRLPADASAEHKLKRFLQDIVNATGKDTKYIFSVYKQFFPATSRAEDIVALLPRIGKKLPEPVLHSDEQVVRRALVEELRDRLRTIWRAEGEATARWRLFKLRSDSWLGPRPAINCEPHPDSKHQELLAIAEPIQRALHCLERNLNKLRTCGNPECSTPFFIADKQKQRYCSGPCARPAQVEWKQRWWREKGQQWRKRKRQQRKKSQILRRKAQ